jgi:D-alanyl-D-alanine carboxypeptidase
MAAASASSGHRLVVVVLRDTKEGAFADTTALLDWAYAQIDTGAFAAPLVAPTPAPAPLAPAPPPTVAPVAAIATASRQANARAATPAVVTSRPSGALGGGTGEQIAPWEEHRALLIASFALVCSSLIVRKLFG